MVAAYVNPPPPPASVYPQGHPSSPRRHPRPACPPSQLRHSCICLAPAPRGPGSRGDRRARWPSSVPCVANRASSSRLFCMVYAIAMARSHQSAAQADAVADIALPAVYETGVTRAYSHSHTCTGMVFDSLPSRINLQLQKHFGVNNCKASQRGHGLVYYDNFTKNKVLMINQYSTGDDSLSPVTVENKVNFLCRFDTSVQ